MPRAEQSNPQALANKRAALDPGPVAVLDNLRGRGLAVARERERVRWRGKETNHE